MARMNDQIAFRVLPKERRIMERAARKQGRTLSEWTRLTLIIEAEIQLGLNLALEAPEEAS